MTERSYQEAVQALRQHMNVRWDGNKTDGYDEMTRILKQSLGFNAHDANTTIDEMIRAGQLRYHTLRNDADEVGDTTADKPGFIATGQVSGANIPGAPIAPGAEFDSGYWEIGQDGDDEIGGRMGQVQPS